MTVGGATSAPLHWFFYAERSMVPAPGQLSPRPVGLRSVDRRTYNGGYGWA